MVGHALAWYRALRSVGETYPVWRLHRLADAGLIEDIEQGHYFT